MLSDTSCTVSTIRAILVPFHGILYCYDIPRYIVILAILYRRVGIDEVSWVSHNTNTLFEYANGQNLTYRVPNDK